MNDYLVQTCGVPSYKKYKRAFLSTNSKKNLIEQTNSIAEKIIIMAETPIYDNFRGAKVKIKFGERIKNALLDFDPENDVIVCFGDQMITVIAVFYLSRRFNKLKIARWSKINHNYSIREIDSDLFESDGVEERENER